MTQAPCFTACLRGQADRATPASPALAPEQDVASQTWGSGCSYVHTHRSLPLAPNWFVFICTGSVHVRSCTHCAACEKRKPHRAPCTACGVRRWDVSDGVMAVGTLSQPPNTAAWANPECDTLKSGTESLPELLLGRLFAHKIWAVYKNDLSI